MVKYYEKGRCLNNTKQSSCPTELKCGCLEGVTEEMTKAEREREITERNTEQSRGVAWKEGILSTQGTSCFFILTFTLLPLRVLQYMQCTRVGCHRTDLNTALIEAVHAFLWGHTGHMGQILKPW